MATSASDSRSPKLSEKLRRIRPVMLRIPTSLPFFNTGKCRILCCCIKVGHQPAVRAGRWCILPESSKRISVRFSFIIFRQNWTFRPYSGMTRITGTGNLNVESVYENKSSLHPDDRGAAFCCHLPARPCDTPLGFRTDGSRTGWLPISFGCRLHYWNPHYRAGQG